MKSDKDCTIINKNITSGDLFMSNILIDFTEELFSEMRISSHIVSLPLQWDDQFDLGLRKTLTGKSDFLPQETFVDFASLYSGDKIKIVFGEDPFTCNYLILPLDPQRVLLAGPFLFEPLSVDSIMELCKRLNISGKYHTYMKQYFATLPKIQSKITLGTYIKCLGNRLFGPGAFEVLSMKNHNDFDFHFSDVIEPEPSTNTIKSMENRYENEEALMECISRGDYEGAEQHFYQPAFLSDLEQRLPDTLRDQKNYLIIGNTLFRKAAQRGKVHPIYLDDLSSKMAAKIENMTSLSQVDALRREMVRKYCFLVKTYSTKGFSPIIQKVLNYTALNLASDLTLKHLSSIFSLNSSYLSAMFKKETGITLTAYVNSKRIDRAVYLLNTQMDSIQDIAILCGIPDLTYFTKLFKKAKGMTPTKYRELITRKNDEGGDLSLSPSQTPPL